MLLEKLKEVGVQDSDLASISETFQNKLDETVQLKLDEEKKLLEVDFTKKLEEGIASEKTKLEEAFNTQLAEKESEMLEALDAFIETQILEKISPELIENAGKAEVATDVLTSLMEVLETKYVKPDSEGSKILEQKEEVLASKTKELDESIAKNIELSKELDLIKKSKLVSEKTVNLSEANKKRIETMFEGRDFVYTEKNLNSFIEMVVEEKKKEETKTDLNESKSVIAGDDKIVAEAKVEEKKPAKNHFLALGDAYIK